MPELPEVETVKRGLERLVIGQTIVSEQHDWPKGFPNAEADVHQFMLGSSILSVRRRAKVLLIDLSTKYTLVIHLKMTGQMVFRGAKDSFGAGHPNESLVGKLPDKSTRVEITFKSGDKLFFNDQRKFGWMRLVPSLEVTNIDFFKRVGPEPLADNFKPADFRARMRRRNNSGLKAVLLDQSVIAGVGNIYADESLWGARLHPETKVSKVSDVKLNTLFAQLQAVLKLSIEKGGSTDRNYVDAEGKRGSYLTFANVFRREGQQCPRCGTVIVKTRVAGRGTHLCPKCQRLVR